MPSAARLTRAALREAEATGNLDPIREAIADSNLDLPQLTPPEPRARRLRRVAIRWGGIAAAGAGIVGIGVFLVLASGNAFDSGRQEPHLAPAWLTSASEETAEPTEPGEPPTPRPGQQGASSWAKGRSFTNGEYTLTVLQVTQGLTQIGEAGTWTSEQGQFVTVLGRVEYTGQGTGYFPLDEQRLRVASGAEYNTDVESSFRSEQNTLGQEPLAAGSPQQVLLVFDIKSSETPAALEFVGDFLSPPLTIPLG